MASGQPSVSPRFSREEGVKSLRWLIKRLLIGVGIILLTMTFTFFLVRLMPGNAVQYIISQMIRTSTMPLEQVYQQVEAIYGIDMDQPLLAQYFSYLWGLLRGDLGSSILYPQTPVMSIIAQAVPWTLFLVGSALLLSFTIGIGLGIVAAYRRGSRLDKGLTFTASILRAIPDFLLGIFLLYYLAAINPIFPFGGNYDIGATPGWDLKFIGSVLYHSLLPMIAFIITGFGGWMLNMRANTVSVLGDDYITAAKARGLSEYVLSTDYVGRNAILPLFTGLALSLGYMFGGVVFIETIFSYPGVGYYLFNAVSGRDYPVMQGAFLLITTSVILSNIIADLLYGWLDPRIREQS